MSFTYHCPNCQHKLTVGDDWDGVQTECPHCQATITIRRETPAEPNGAAGIASPQPRHRKKSSASRWLVYGVLVVLLILVMGVNLYLAISDDQMPPVNEGEVAPQEAVTPQEATQEAPQEATQEAPSPAETAEANDAEPPATSATEAEAEVRQYAPPAPMQKRYEQLAEAVKAGELDKAKGLLLDDAQPFLMMACRYGDTEVVRLLLEAGADPTAPGKGGLTPATIAAKAGAVECLKLLFIEKRDLPDKRDLHDHSPMYYAVTGGKLEAVEYLCQAGANVNTLEEDETWTPLLAAISKGDEAMLKLLLKHGADLDKTASDGHTPLYVAITSGQQKIVEAICWRRRRLDFHWEEGFTPLMTAVDAGNAQVVKTLLDCGANPNMPDKSGVRYPITIAQEENNLELLELLMKYGAVSHKKTQENAENPQDILEKLKANTAKEKEGDKEPKEEDARPNGKLRLADIITGEKFRGNMKLVSNMQNKNLPPPYELTQPQKKYGVFVIHPGSSTHQHKGDRLFPSQMDHKITVFFSQKSNRNWGFVMETVKFHKPLEFQKQLRDLITKNYNLEENEETTDLQEELAEKDPGHLGDFIAAATQSKFKEKGEEKGGPWNQDQVFYNGEFLAVLYTHPYKRFSETIAQDKKCKLYLLYVDMEMYKKACKELD
ncbi:MAG: ankyrin repeat domain-containing protein [Victivallales bacterium]|nr:ankyrin repeat domain-containing protein [Victivallales bacterium]